MKITEWKSYQMWRRAACAITNGGNSAEWLGEWRPTEKFFSARSQAEAQKKADKFWREAELGFGSMVCLPIGTRPGLRARVKESE